MFGNGIKTKTRIFEIYKHDTGKETWDWNTDELDKLLSDGWEIANTIGDNKIILIMKIGIV